jgi:ABC-2 type transport system ATP-binding protein
MSIATLTDLTIAYGPKVAVSNLSVEIPEGCVGLLGPNGAGKTTLIKTLMGFLTPASGSANVLGMDVRREGLRLRQRIGLMPEQDCHIPGMNAVSFVAYAGELSGMPRSQAMRRAHEVLEYCGLGEARYRNVETYSTGMKQRIKLAQALVHGPKLMFLDEPTNGLDPAGREDMLTLVRDISHGKGVNVVVSSHLLPDVERTCDNVIVMREGHLAREGDIATLKQGNEAHVDVELYAASDAFLESAAKRGAALVSRLGSRYTLRIAEGVDCGRLLFESAGESGAQVRGFRPSLRTLEDIFMEAMQ